MQACNSAYCLLGDASQPDESGMVGFALTVGSSGTAEVLKHKRTSLETPGSTKEWRGKPPRHR